METHRQESPAPIRSQKTVDESERLRRHEEAMLDEALAATFPCSDPVSTLSVDETREERAESHG